MFSDKPYVKETIYTEPELAEKEIGEASRSNISLQQNDDAPFSLGMRFIVSEQIFAAEYKSLSEGVLSYESEMRCIGISVVQEGSGAIYRDNQRIYVTKDEVAVFDAGRSKGYATSGTTNALSLFIPIHRIVESAIRFSDKPFRDKGDWAQKYSVGTPLGQSMRALAGATVANIELCAQDYRASKLILKRCEEALTLLILEQSDIFQNPQGTSGKSLPANWQYRRAIEIIQSEEIVNTVGELASVLGMSVRAVHAAFQKHAGVSPYTVIRNERYRKVREAIERGEITSWKHIRDRFCVTNISRFSSEYSRMFGETPLNHIHRIAGGGDRSAV